MSEIRPLMSLIQLIAPTNATKRKASDPFLAALGCVEMKRSYYDDDLDGWRENQVYKAHREDHDGSIGNDADERSTVMSDTKDTFLYHGVAVTHHLETDTYEVRGEMFISLAAARAYIDDAKDL